MVDIGTHSAILDWPRTSTASPAEPFLLTLPAVVWSEGITQQLSSSTAHNQLGILLFSLGKRMVKNWAGEVAQGSRMLAAGLS